MNRAARLLFPLLWAVLLAGCSAQPHTATVNTDGSSSMEKLIKGLSEAFMAEHSGVTVNYNGSGSGAGIEAALTGTADLGLASRPLRESEEAEGAVGYVVALDGVAVVVHPDNPIESLSVEQLARLFRGEVANWSELGGADAPVAAYGREAGSGTRSSFEEAVGVVDICRYTNEYSATGDVVGSVANNPNAIGYAAFSTVNDAVKAIRIDGIACTAENIRSGRYPICQTFLLVIRADAALSDAAQAFLDYARSAEAAWVIDLMGLTAP